MDMKYFISSIPAEEWRVHWILEDTGSDFLVQTLKTVLEVEFKYIHTYDGKEVKPLWENPWV